MKNQKTKDRSEWVDTGHHIRVTTGLTELSLDAEGKDRKQQEKRLSVLERGQFFPLRTSPDHKPKPVFARKEGYKEIWDKNRKSCWTSGEIPSKRANRNLAIARCGAKH